MLATLRLTLVFFLLVAVLDVLAIVVVVVIVWAPDKLHYDIASEISMKLCIIVVQVRVSAGIVYAYVSEQPAERIAMH